MIKVSLGLGHRYEGTPTQHYPSQPLLDIISSGWMLLMTLSVYLTISRISKVRCDGSFFSIEQACQKLGIVPN